MKQRRNVRAKLAAGATGVVAMLLAQGCASEGDDPFAGPKGVSLTEDPPESLSDMHLMRWNGEEVEYADEVVPYELNTPLFSDYAVKRRAVYIPEGKKATYSDNDVLEFPVGTVILKSFLFPEDLRKPDENLDIIETRVLVRYEDGWETYPYIWNEDDTDATLQVGGMPLTRTFVDEDGAERTANYLVPQKNQCIACHELKDPDTGARYTTPIGPKARHLNLDYGYEEGASNQLQQLVDRGLLDGLPAMSEVDQSFDWSSFEPDQIDGMSFAELEQAARDYLDVNCAHCHNPNGVSGVSSQLFLNHDNEDLFHLGVCKKPGSAGKGGADRTYDIVPGDPDASILWYRMDTEDVGSMMPQIGRSLAHTRGNAVIYAWIAGLELDPCSDQTGQ